MSLSQRTVDENRPISFFQQVKAKTLMKLFMRSAISSAACSWIHIQRMSGIRAFVKAFVVLWKSNVDQQYARWIKTNKLHVWVASISCRVVEPAPNWSSTAGRLVERWQVTSTIADEETTLDSISFYPPVLWTTCHWLWVASFCHSFWILSSFLIDKRPYNWRFLVPIAFLPFRFYLSRSDIH